MEKERIIGVSWTSAVVLICMVLFVAGYDVLSYVIMLVGILSVVLYYWRATKRSERLRRESRDEMLQRIYEKAALLTLEITLPASAVGYVIVFFYDRELSLVLVPFLVLYAYTYMISCGYYWYKYR
jgi:uncharacterized membrane protein YfcA